MLFALEIRGNAQYGYAEKAHAGSCDQLWGAVAKLDPMGARTFYGKRDQRAQSLFRRDQAHTDLLSCLKTAQIEKVGAAVSNRTP